VDPWTAACLALAEGFRLARVIIESDPPALRAEKAQRLWTDLQFLRDFFDHLTPPSQTTQAQVDTAMSGERVRLAREKKDGA